MKISYIITINPVNHIDIMNMLVHSLNLQTNNSFEVVFYNQTKFTVEEIISRLTIKPIFEYSFHSISPKHFFGDYPMWDLYGFHQFLLDNSLLSDYFMSLHMEEFLDFDYTEKIIDVLDANGFDILMGNLHSTTLHYQDISSTLEITNPIEYDHAIRKILINRACKWSLRRKPWYLTRNPVKNLRKSLSLGRKRTFAKTSEGYVQLDRYLFEDVYAMSTKFAQQYSWFDSPQPLYFEDIHINWRMAPAVSEVTRFPVYLNASKVYHLMHEKYYYQIQNTEFASGILRQPSENPVIVSLQKAIELYRNSEVTAMEAIRYSRKTGTVDQNVKFHLECIEKVLAKK